MKKFPNPLENKNYDTDSSIQNDDDYLSIKHFHESDYEDDDVLFVEAEEESAAEEEKIDEEEKQEPENTQQPAEEKKQNDDKSNEQNGKYFVIKKGMACCNKGAKFPKFKVTSHQKHYWNDEKGEADYLAVTEDDLTFDPTATPFGTCSVKNGNPCSYAPAGKWTKTYDKIKIMGKKPLTELSELMCTVGGKITVMKHGQQSEAGKSNVKNAISKEQQAYNPIMDFGEFQDEISQSDQLYYE